MDEQAARFVEAVRRGDAAGLADLYEEEAVLLVPAMAPVYGRQAIQAFWLSGIEMGLKRLLFRSQGWNRAAELWVEVGTFAITMAGEEEATTEEKGAFVVIGRPDQNGECRWVVHFLSSNAGQKLASGKRRPRQARDVRYPAS